MSDKPIKRNGAWYYRRKIDNLTQETIEGRATNLELRQILDSCAETLENSIIHEKQVQEQLKEYQKLRETERAESKVTIETISSYIKSLEESVDRATKETIRVKSGQHLYFALGAIATLTIQEVSQNSLATFLGSLLAYSLLWLNRDKLP